MSKRITQEAFIASCKNVWGNEYDFSQSIYRGRKEKVSVICKKHGAFYKDPEHLLSRRQGCPECTKERLGYIPSKSKTQEEFITQCKEIHGDKYDLSKVEYRGSNLRVKMICKTHGEFAALPSDIIAKHAGCPECGKINGGLKGRISQEEYIKRCKDVWEDRYDLSKIEYNTLLKKITVVCPEHGEFHPLAGNFLNGHGCRKCCIEETAKRQMHTLEEFVEKASKIHRGKYDYSKVVYLGNKKNVEVICPTHGSFWQRPDCHIHGEGCPICRESIGERAVRYFLEDNHIEYEREKKFDGCKSLRQLRFDFYLPKYNTCIEFQGKQHYEPNSIFDKDGGYLETLHRDEIKRDYCKRNGILLIEVRYNENIAEALNMFNK